MFVGVLHDSKRYTYHNIHVHTVQCTRHYLNFILMTTQLLHGLCAYIFSSQRILDIDFRHDDGTIAKMDNGQTMYTCSQISTLLKTQIKRNFFLKPIKHTRPRESLSQRNIFKSATFPCE